jgi:sugar phosphate isomerase/epimerase
VENLEDSLFELALPVIERLGVNICLDVGHLAWQGSDAIGFLLRHHDRIHEVHLHDCGPVAGDGDRPVRDHLPLGAGNVDYAALLHKLVDLGYDSTVILEVNSKADLEQSLEQVRAILPYASREQRREEE